jgi:hypothetical protein
LENIPVFETSLISRFLPTVTQALRRAKAIFNEKLIKTIARKQKTKLKQDKIRVLNKLKKQERLTDDEFWRVYESIWQEGPKVRYPNP